MASANCNSTEIDKKHTSDEQLQLWPDAIEIFQFDDEDDDDDGINVILNTQPKPTPQIIVDLLKDASLATTTEKFANKTNIIRLHLKEANQWIYLPHDSINDTAREYATQYISGGDVISKKFLDKINKGFAEQQQESLVVDDIFLVLSHSQLDHTDHDHKTCIAPLAISVALCRVNEHHQLRVLDISMTQLAHGVANTFGHFDLLISVTKNLNPNIPIYFYYPERWGNIYKSHLYSFNDQLLSMPKHNLIDNFIFKVAAWNRKECPLEGESSIHPVACSLCNLMITLTNIAGVGVKRRPVTAKPHTQGHRSIKQIGALGRVLEARKKQGINRLVQHSSRIRHNRLVPRTKTNRTVKLYNSKHER